MGRIKVVLLGIAYLGLLVSITPVTAQESANEQKSPAKSTATTKQINPWNKVADGIWKVSISGFPYSKEEESNPEFALLRLSSARYVEFQKNAKDFVNDHKVFKHKVNKLAPCKAPKQKSSKDEPAFWYVIIPHWPSSTAICHPYAGGDEPGEPD